ncbi:hypothetical protein PF005_g3975 [Phytophthora fragariae]|uniref:Uncharacterized protein n=1 Tax=Phytophthora fragariae TaxID=53985 RepID=A0A6A3FH12_9STRA|nr:hypothetical protein PF003_g7267 [Phytophthora fragariae]KAE8944433.1 hypothetical protein PF009_g5881 [Phytophthora fragariae]KAE9019430.1 hypothetical protein PF011_g5832 [Phytophthora fragariae]KAE9128047.1 hypothetical protein PF007_g5394 [Phytophthora fragariae]KAE9151155.1 hypothetical protein PF006_g4525 [Phytophthora fragariae]
MSSHADADVEEVETEPQPHTSAGQGAARIAVASHTDRPKIDLKLITIEPFDGTAKDGYLDPGAYDWLKRLKVQINLVETLTERK